MYTSIFQGLSLSEYIRARTEHCRNTHNSPCHECTSLLLIARGVEANGWKKLGEAFKSAFPNVTYTAAYARRRFLQMPLVCIRVDYKPGVHECYLLEHVPGVNYQHFLHLFHTAAQRTPQQTATLGKQEVKSLLSVCTSDQERAYLRYAVFKASGLSATQARKHFGFQNITKHTKNVEEALERCQSIRNSIEKLANIQEKSLLISLGIPVQSDTEESDEESNDSADSLSDAEVCPTGCEKTLPCLLEIIKKSNFNWFEIMEVLTVQHRDVESEQLKEEIGALELTNKEKQLLNVSYEAFTASEQCERDRNLVADSLNGYIVSESEDEATPSEIQKASSPIDPQLHKVILKRRAAIRRKARREQAKKIAQANILSRKRSRKVQGILAKFPDIGTKIEEFVRNRNVGADKWRRTGLLTFDGNVKVSQKVTYERIRQHLQEEYKCSFGYGTIVQLCVARNKRRRSALRYKGVAQVTTRRARRGFALRFNPDKHWSSALYRSLNYLQYADGRDILNVNRDDAAGFRLDTMTTNKHYATPAVVGEDVHTTYTDYMNKYPSQLQVTSYNFSKTKTTPEQCAGVVKASFIYQKNPAQHSADLDMLEEAEELKGAFVNPSSGQSKSIECIRVDGAGDENPSHEEVQFWWTLRHIKKKSLATLVTTRSSGSSYLNRVELQNGCLTRGHANLFIPSTLGGDPMETSTLNKEILQKNLELATEVYINYVNKCPCGDTVIHLFKGADSCRNQHIRDQLKIFLKGSKVKKEQLKLAEPELYKLFNEVWRVREQHMVSGLPNQYIFYLLCCFDENCIHCRCKESSGMCRDMFTWFSGGPPLTYIPLPVPDQKRPWGSKECVECCGFCAGHYLTPEELISNRQQQPILPPSTQIQEVFNSNIDLSDANVRSLAERVLLSVEDVNIWISHLTKVQRNRKEGAAKAAATRRKSRKADKQQQQYKCGVCRAIFEEETEETEMWIGCEECDSWYHWRCVGITVEPDTYTCTTCSTKL